LQNEDFEADLRAIRNAVESKPDATITGGKLADIIRSTAPNLDVRAALGSPRGTGAVAEFVRRFLPDILKQSGNQGADVVYQIAGREMEIGPAQSGPEIWRTFVSPNSIKHLILSSSGRLFPRDTPATSAENETEVAKATASEHDAIRADFTDQLPTPEASKLKEHVGTSPDFESWIEALKTYLPEANSRWGQFRRKRLSELLNGRILSLNLEEPTKQDVLNQIQASEMAAYPTDKGKRGTPEKRTSGKTLGADDAHDLTDRARRVAHAAIDQLSYEELREIRLPLGAILDAFTAGV
jgi:hypothetical protein